MQDCKIIPLSGEGIFSPDGKHLVVCAEDKIAVYDTISGNIKGILPNLPASYDSRNLPSWYRFSPKGTYLSATYEGKIWTIADLKEYLPGILASRQIELWNKQETIFLTSPSQGKPTPAPIWHVHNALDGSMLHSIDHRQYENGVPLYPRISSDGSLLAFIYEINNFRHKGTVAVITNLNNKVQNGFEIQKISDVHQVEFCPDNEHALVAIKPALICIHNFKIHKMVDHFTGASQIEGYIHNFSGPNRIQNSCSIKLQGFISVISNRLNKKEKYIITQDEQKPHIFTCAKYIKPETQQKITPSPLGSVEFLKV